ncbi:MAG: hypothetical protein J6T10_10600 [Methanobrevibacter sp.]|nr:hypothetical protein [Methanobrevibacter sp.]
MIQDYDRPVKGYKTAEMYDHPATVLYDNFAPAEEVFIETAVEEVPLTEEIIEEPIVEITEEVEPAVEEIIEEEKEGEE